MSDEDYEEAREMLRRRRLLLGLRQKDVADRIGSTETYICALERGRHIPQHHTWTRWAKALGYDVSIVLTDDGTHGGGRVPWPQGRPRSGRPPRGRGAVA